MRLNGNNSRVSPLILGIAVVALSAAFGYWNAEIPPIKPHPDSKSTSDIRPIDEDKFEQMELTLAQAGCPGWMVLASEGQEALQPSEPRTSAPSKNLSSQIEQTAYEVAGIATRDPSSARANRMLLAARGRHAKLTNGAINDPNDLLDGVPDLLAAPDPPVQVEPSRDIPTINAPEPDSSSVVEPPASESESGPSFLIEPVETEPPVQAPIEVQPRLPQPTSPRGFDPPPAIEETPSPTAAPAARSKPVFGPPPTDSQPVSKPQPAKLPTTQPTTQPTTELTTPPATTAPVMPQPATPQIPARIPQPVQPSTPPARLQHPLPAPPQRKPQLPVVAPVTEQPVAPTREQIAVPPPRRERVVAPQRPQPEPPLVYPTQPVEKKPQQSPFAPPPKPQQAAPHSTGAAVGHTTDKKKDDDETKTYCEYIAESQYPSAFVCAKCHQKIFDEWSISSHAYAAISPMFHKFEQTINNLSNGTVGYFCYRCHVPVGTSMGVSRATPLWDLPYVAREGVTCIACHRVNQRYGKVHGHRRIEPGSVYDKVYGSIGGGGIAEVVAKKDHYKVKTSPHDKGPGQDIHVVGESFDQLGKSEFCVSCHQVAVHPGIKLEVVWEQYRASPACKKGVSCQDCHMGRIPGVPSGYETGSAAEISKKSVNKNRKHANHVFYGPGYSIAHPGIFPHNKDALRWPMQDWLQFNWRAGWGTDDFEEALEDGKIHAQFPKIWQEADDRYDAREVLDDNLKKLEVKKLSRQQTMENGSHVDGPYFDTPLTRNQKLKFHYIMTNTNEGHNLPSGSLGAQPQLWANVVLIGPRGQRLWESGYTDSYGDVCDFHSVDVQNKRVPYDWQLFNLQTMFLITGAKGTDREFFLPVNLDIDQLAYLRPGPQPTSVINHPPFIRMEGRSLAPLGSRKIPYQIPAELMREPGHYRLSFRLRSRAEPIYFMRFCGSTKEMNRAMNEWIVDFHESSVEFFVR